MSTPLDPAVKKAYEVSYALFRVAAVLPSRGFAELLEKEALNLLAYTVRNLSVEAQASLTTIHYLISLGKDTNNIHPENAELLVRQLESLSTMLHDRAVNAVTPADLSQIFSATESSIAEPKVAASSIAASRVAEPAEQPAKSVRPAMHAPAIMPLNSRQNIILGRIRQSGNCHTRDIQEALPDLSERTLRYDLQRLVEEGRIERGGGGGPASWYRIKDGNPQSNVSGGASL